MIKIISYNFHDSFFKFFKKIPNIEVTLVEPHELSNLSDQYDYAVVAEFPLESYKNIKCKRILIDTVPPRRLTEIQKYAYFDPNTEYIVFSTYRQLIECGLRPNSKVKVINWAIDVNVFGVWTGGVDKVLGVCNIISRPPCGESIWRSVTDKLPKDLVGYGNDHLTESVGFKNTTELYNMYKNYNVFLHHTTTSCLMFY